MITPTAFLSLLRYTTSGFSGADLAALVREAGLAVVKESIISSASYSDNQEQLRVSGKNMRASSSSTTTSSGSAVVTTIINNTDVNTHGPSLISTSTTATVTSATTHTDTSPCISRRHFEVALCTVRPSVSQEDKLRYDKVHELVKSGVGAIQALRIARNMYPI